MQYLKDIGFREAVRELGGLSSLRGRVSSGTAKPAPASVSSDVRPLPTPAPDRTVRAPLGIDRRADDSEPIVQEEMQSGRVCSRRSRECRLSAAGRGGTGGGIRSRGTTKALPLVHGEKGLFIQGRSHPERRVLSSRHRGVKLPRARGTGSLCRRREARIERPARMARLLQARAMRSSRRSKCRTKVRIAWPGSRMRELLGSEVRRDQPRKPTGRIGRAAPSYEPSTVWARTPRLHNVGAGAAVERGLVR